MHTFDEVEKVDLWFVEERLCAKGIASEEATARTRELKRYLALGAQLGELPMLSPEIDEAWHTFLLFTREYEEFCRTHFGQFLHHHPGPSEPDSVTPEQFVAAYRETFGKLPPIWKTASDCSSGEGPACKSAHSDCGSNGPEAPCSSVRNDCSTGGKPGGKPKPMPFDWAPIAARLVTKGAVPPDRIDEVLTELQRFLQLAAVHGSDVNVHSPLVDAAWHELILFTADYARYCETTFGRYIHHRPFTSRTIATGAPREEFVRRYERAFGIAVPPLWLEGASECGGCDSCSSH
jgi:hypothetical protein